MMLVLVRRRFPLSAVRRCLSNEPRAFSRKKNSNSGPISSNFNVAVARIFSSIEDTLRPLLSLNKDFELIVKPGEEIRLKVGNSERGHYVFIPNYDSELLRVNSPYSGTFEYFHCPDTENWLCVIDRHDMRGIITRDLLKHCIGCPQFP